MRAIGKRPLASQRPGLQHGPPLRFGFRGGALLLKNPLATKRAQYGLMKEYTFNDISIDLNIDVDVDLDMWLNWGIYLKSYYGYPI